MSQVKTAEELFYQLKELESFIPGLHRLAGIVQNEHVINTEEWDEWTNSFDKYIDNMKEYHKTIAKLATDAQVEMIKFYHAQKESR